MKVCVVGSGGREHALAVALGRTADVVVTPGNPGIPGVTAEGHLVSCSDAPAEEIDADLVVIGPESPLVAGLADRLRARGRLVFGPGADGALLEGSKAYMKQVLAEAGIPTARHGAFTEPHEAIAYLKSLPGPWVVKTDGLASGKGVLVTDSIAQAEADVISKLSGETFGDAGRRIVIEEALDGVECTVHVLCDGTRVVPLVSARDYKRLGDSDVGPNTGGMGCNSPVPAVDDALVARVVDECVEPLVGLLRKRGIDYRGVLYTGLMLTSEGPKVLEYNVRFGDPETQVVMPRTVGDLTALFSAVAAGKLSDEVPKSTGAAVCVVLTADGYPGSVRAGDEILGLEEASEVEGVMLSYAGVAAATHAGGDSLVTAGGRVLGVTGIGDSLARARDRAYAACSSIHWDGMHRRGDIALADTAVLNSGRLDSGGLETGGIEVASR
jgi:phosphoribosylamine--glycine ligase